MENWSGSRILSSIQECVSLQPLVRVVLPHCPGLSPPFRPCWVVVSLGSSYPDGFVGTDGSVSRSPLPSGWKRTRTGRREGWREALVMFNQHASGSHVYIRRCIPKSYGILGQFSFQTCSLWISHNWLALLFWSLLLNHHRFTVSRSSPGKAQT